MRNQQAMMSVIVFFWIGMMAVLLYALTSHAPQNPPVGALAANLSAPRRESTATPQAVPEVAAIPVQPDESDPSKVIAPYPSYTLTQGPHGFSYGQMAIDLTAGKGATIHSPISGVVFQLFTDYLGNPTLIIDNDIYQVTLMHGNYTVETGQHLKIGDPVGTESNNGNTVDWNGISCRGRDCGYHTHLNIFDKRIGQNINPLDVIPPSQ